MRNHSWPAPPLFSSHADAGPPSGPSPPGRMGRASSCSGQVSTTPSSRSSPAITRPPAATELRAQGQTGFVQTLRAGETRELVQRLRASDLALGVGEATISLSLRYRRTSGQVEESPARTMVAVLEPARRFVSVANPYSRYSGG